MPGDIVNLSSDEDMLSEVADERSRSYFNRPRSHNHQNLYYLEVPLRVLVESTSRVSPTHYTR